MLRNNSVNYFEFCPTIDKDCIFQSAMLARHSDKSQIVTLIRKGSLSLVHTRE